MMCKYDGFCTRRNPAHFAEFSHLRQRSTRATGGLGASASASGSASASASAAATRATEDSVIDLTEDSDNGDDGGGGGGGGGGEARSRGLLRPTAGLTCPICLCDEAPGACVELRGCNHGFCEDCITQHIRLKVADGEVLPASLQCPGVDPRCAQPIDPTDVELCLEGPNEVARYERLTLSRFVESNAETMGTCPTAGCAFVFEYDLANRKLQCPLCGKSVCLVCRVEPWHTGIRCEQWQAEHGNAEAADEVFASFASKAKLKQCPKCRFWVEKDDGCDAMHCRCQLVFCYKCGGVNKPGSGSAKGTAVKKCVCGSAPLLAIHEGAPNHNNPRPAAAAAAAGPGPGILQQLQHRWR